jgi:hypothetical protein
MSYRNKTYVAFASEDIKQYWLMKAWRENEHIEFEFFDAHASTRHGTPARRRPSRGGCASE